MTALAHSWRSLLFVPGDRPDRFAKAASSGADAVIVDLEDAVAPERKPFARDAVREWLAQLPALPTLVRINPLTSGLSSADCAALADTHATALVLPKAQGAADVSTLATLSALPVLPIATETPAAIFALGSYASVAERLIGLTWGAEDLPAAIGATAARLPDGDYTPPLALVRSLALFAAHAAGVAAIDTVWPDLADAAGLAAHVARARRDGFTGMLALHPAQIDAIHAGFAPSAAEVDAAAAIISAFAAAPEAGALRVGGRMVDAPHFAAARRLLARTSITS